MTAKALYLLAKKELAAAGAEAFSEEASALSRHFLGLSRGELAVHGESIPAPAREAAFLDAVNQRRSGRPLQYILGQWEFMGLSLSVGEGVLIPREDTSALVEAVAAALSGCEAPCGLDLCAGSGAVALGLCTLVPGAHVTCVELSEEAAPYLEKNLAAYPAYAVTAKKGDVLSAETPALFQAVRGNLDFIVSNPPYISSALLPTLQREVRKEPQMALDGGPDGLLFYRAILELWVPLLRSGGVLAVEIGDDQGDAVPALFRAAGLKETTLHRDFNGHPRAVTARKP